MVRRENNLPEEAKQPTGFHIARNPGAMCLWTTHSFRLFFAKPGDKVPLITVGDPEAVEWWANGQPATRAQVEESVRTGLPLLEDAARLTGAAGLNQLAREVKAAQSLYPLD